jgi:hypothetical protein
MDLPAEQLFSMSAFEALKNIRKYRSTYTNLAETDLLRLIQTLEIGAIDYEAALSLDDLVPSTDGMSDTTFLRTCIEVLLKSNPIWIRSVTLGRSKFVQKLERDQSSCFRCARLLDQPAPEDIENWWSTMMSYSRASIDALKSDQGRRAEKMSLEFERRRILELGINGAPIWMSLEDNTVGYDIVSFELGEKEPINLLIEVKSFVSSGSFFLTRNEWRAASKYRDRYQFHIWDMTRQRLYQMSAQEVGLHIPTDAQGGQWEQSTISVPLNHSYCDVSNYFIPSTESL